MVAKGWARRHDTWGDLAESVGAHVVTLNQPGLVSKQKPDGTWEHRIIWDLLRSGVNATARQGERI
eukprot:5468725-Lingulodinium_polyedra.AAC.1